MIKIILISIFLFIVYNLGVALYHLVKRKSTDSPSPDILKALTNRITISVILFVLVFLLVATGLFKPHGTGSRIQQKPLPEAANTNK